MFKKSVLLVILAVVWFDASGHQHGIFRSQSTQGAPWTGSMRFIGEKFDVTIYKEYLDVELEWEVAADGEKPTEYTDALEIVGNIDLEPQSAILGMLLWYKGRILKAKLQNKNLAREQYEEVVDRNAEIPPPPRDPVLLEYGARSDNYDISIFPVDWSGSRKLRMRYVVPIGNRGKPGRFGYPHPFSFHARMVFRKSDEIAGFTLQGTYGPMAEVTEDSIVILTDGEEYKKNKPWYILPVVNTDTDNNRATQINMTEFTMGNITGELAVFSDFAVGRLLDSLKTQLPTDDENRLDGKLGVYAVLSNGAERCSTGVGDQAVTDIDKLSDSLAWKKSVAVFSKKPIEKKIEWHIYLNGDLWMTYDEQIASEEGTNDAARINGCIAARRGCLMALDSRIPRSLAPVFGYVDTIYALLALEKDTISKLLEEAYDKQGVPLLEREDIFSQKGDLESETETPFFVANEYNIQLKVTRRTTEIDRFSSLRITVKNAFLVLDLENVPYSQNGIAEVSIIALSGKILARTVVRVSPGNKEVRIGLNGLHAQTVVVQIKINGRKYSKVVNLSCQYNGRPGNY